MVKKDAERSPQVHLVLLYVVLVALNPAGIFHRKLVLREHRFFMDCWSALPENVYAQDGAGWINIMDRLLGNGREFLLQSCLLRF